ncbi:MAG: hypothetical protein UHD09_07530 [Bifidobacterium sp.]|nr:hypothetical protein [Bifidobacterium sp.]
MKPSQREGFLVFPPKTPSSSHPVCHRRVVVAAHRVAASPATAAHRVAARRAPHRVVPHRRTARLFPVSLNATPPRMHYPWNHE